MWRVADLMITMTEGDFGIKLPVTLNGVTMSANDEIRLTIKDRVNSEALVTKTYSDIQEETFNIELTEADTGKLPAGSYVYSVDWYQDGFFMCCLVEKAPFKVVEKA